MAKSSGGNSKISFGKKKSSKGKGKKNTDQESISQKHMQVKAEHKKSPSFDGLFYQFVRTKLVMYIIE